MAAYSKIKNDIFYKNIIGYTITINNILLLFLFKKGRNIRTKVIYIIYIVIYINTIIKLEQFFIIKKTLKICQGDFFLKEINFCIQQKIHYIDQEWQ